MWSAACRRSHPRAAACRPTNKKSEVSACARVRARAQRRVRIAAGVEISARAAVEREVVLVGWRGVGASSGLTCESAYRQLAPIVRSTAHAQCVGARLEAVRVPLVDDFGHLASCLLLLLVSVGVRAHGRRRQR
jgi:hypothetical protein